MSRQPTRTRTEPDAKAKLPVLFSYFHLREKPREFREWMLRNPKVEVLLDSGGFSALNVGGEVRLDDYMAFLDEWKEHLFGYVALDVLGDPAGSEENLRIMHEAGFRPIPVHVRGDGQERMDELFEHSDWVALGGLRRPHRGHCPPSYLYQKHEWTRGRNVHWLGYVRQKHVTALRPYSVDCSSWTSPFRYGQACLYVGNGNWKRTTIPRVMDGTDKWFNNRDARKWLEWCGQSEGDLRDPKRWRQDVRREPLERNMGLHLAASSWVRYSRDIRAKYGTRLFIATIGRTGEVEFLYHYADRTDPDEGAPYDNPLFG